MTAIKKIAVFTGTRAEYGLLYWLLNDIQASENLELQLIVSGTHLSEIHGYTVEKIEADGFRVDYRVDLELDGRDERVDIARAAGRAVSGTASALDALEPDVLILLGDRYELLGAATAALLSGVPIFHLHGGELTEGAYDDSIRHGITKMASWHGVANEVYRRRVIQMGEFPDTVFNVGGLGLDSLTRLGFMTRSELENELDFRFAEKTIFVTYHPVTNDSGEDVGFDHLLAILAKHDDIHVMFTFPNADHGHMAFIQKIEAFTQTFPERSRCWRSLGQLRYLSVLQFVKAVVGNSSSGIIEAPSFGVGTVNIGERQAGRLRAASVVDCEPDPTEIERALLHMFEPGYQASLGNIENPYGSGGAAKRLTRILSCCRGSPASTRAFTASLTS